MGKSSDILERGRRNDMIRRERKVLWNPRPHRLLQALTRSLMSGLVRHRTMQICIRVVVFNQSACIRPHDISLVTSCAEQPGFRSLGQ